MQPNEMQDRRVLVTGSGTGIGRGIALEFARVGAAVALHYGRDREGAESAVEEISGQLRILQVWRTLLLIALLLFLVSFLSGFAHDMEARSPLGNEHA